ncbi:hypothetical protein RJ641_029723, partial [Dillenia turbinata]
ILSAAAAVVVMTTCEKALKLWGTKNMLCFFMRGALVYGISVTTASWTPQPPLPKPFAMLYLGELLSHGRGGSSDIRLENFCF